MLVQSVNRALKILMQFSGQVESLGITDISKALGVTKGAAHGLVSTLAEAGFLWQDPRTKKYKLGLRVFELGMMQPHTLNLNRCAAGPAMKLTGSEGLITRVAIWDGDYVLVTATHYPENRPELSRTLGPRTHAYCTSLGKAILAHRPEKELGRYLENIPLKPFTSNTITDSDVLIREIGAAREMGYAVDREESFHGVYCLGAPVFHGEGGAMGALSISGSPEAIRDKNRAGGLARALVRAAAEISRALINLRPAL